MQAASKMNRFPPAPAVLTSVLMTRPAYAQLQGQVFHPPRVFGPEWHVREGKELDNERRWRDSGVKIATGFEIMYKEGGRGRSGEVSYRYLFGMSKADNQGAVDDKAVRADPKYGKYIADLTSAGFFGREMEGSEKWKSREAEALRGWRSSRSSE
jgi:hypothetical protein